MTVNESMLIIAEQMADELGYIKVDESLNNGKNDGFWANRLLGLTKYIQVKQCKYVFPQFEEDKDIRKRPPVISIDMFWGEPRLSIELTDGTLACITYKDGHVSSAQAFGDKGLEFALDIQHRINELINK